MKIYVYGLSLMKDELKVITGILGGVKKRVEKELEFDIIDLMSNNESEANYPCIIFGKQVLNQLTIPSEEEELMDIWMFPSITNLVKKDKEATIKTKEMIEKVATYLNGNTEIKEVKADEPTTLCVEKKGTTFGIIADIMITEKEAEYLKRIKDLLDGSKIVIKKGDITIEVS